MIELPVTLVCDGCGRRVQHVVPMPEGLGAPSARLDEVPAPAGWTLRLDAPVMVKHRTVCPLKTWCPDCKPPEAD